MRDISDTAAAVAWLEDLDQNPWRPPWAGYSRAAMVDIRRTACACDPDPDDRRFDPMQTHKCPMGKAVSVCTASFPMTPEDEERWIRYHVVWSPSSLDAYNESQRKAQ